MTMFQVAVCNVVTGRVINKRFPTWGEAREYADQQKGDRGWSVRTIIEKVPADQSEMLLSILS